LAPVCLSAATFVTETPYRGTALHAQMESEGRVLAGRGWEFYNGYNVAFRPAKMTPEELLAAHRALWREAFSVRYSLKRILRGLFRLRLGAFLMSAVMNLFYCVKALRGNTPACFGAGADHRYDEFRHLPGLPVRPEVRTAAPRHERLEVVAAPPV